MRKDYQNLFQSLERVSPSDELFFAILAKIERRTRWLARFKLVILGTAALVSLFATIPAFNYTYQEFAKSGFFQYLSLLFSDSSVVLSYWYDFMLSLVESLPFLAVAILLMSIFIFLESLRFAAKNIKLAFH